MISRPIVSRIGDLHTAWDVGLRNPVENHASAGDKRLESVRPNCLNFQVVDGTIGSPGGIAAVRLKREPNSRSQLLHRKSRITRRDRSGAIETFLAISIFISEVAVWGSPGGIA